MSNKALLVGCNKFRHYPDNSLNGCVNDLTNIRDVLIKYYGFEPNDIRALADDRATKVNIMERLDWLVRDAQSGDRLLFSFSAHGSQIRDRNGDDLRDGLDEILCTHDFNFDNGLYITDDELSFLFKSIPAGVSLDVILDCCHSGTALRDIGNPHPILPRRIVPPIDIQMRAWDEKEELSVTNIGSAVRGENAQNANAILFAGCRDNQTSADAYISDSYNGAFTYYLCKTIREHQGKVSRQDLIKHIDMSLRYNGYSQVGQLEGDKSRKMAEFLNIT